MMQFSKRAASCLLVYLLASTSVNTAHPLNVKRESTRFSPAAVREAAGQTATAQKPAQADGAGAALAKGKALLRRGKAAEALVQFEAALKLFEQAKSVRGQAATHDLLGELYERQGRYDLALEHFKRAQQLFASAGSEMSAQKLFASAVLTNFDAYRSNLTLSKVGNMYYRQGKIPEARAAYAQMSVKKPDTSAFGKAKKAGGMFGKLTSIASGGVSGAMSAGSLAKERVEAYQQTIVYTAHEMGLGRADFHEENLDGARKHFENALAAAKGDIPIIGQLGQTQRYRTFARTSLADIALRQERYPDASKLYADAIKGAQDDKRLDLMWPAQRGLGRSRWLLAASEADPKKGAKLRDDALAAYRDALKTIETLRQGSLRADEARTTFLASTKDVFDEASSALAEMALMSAPASAASLEGQALQYASESLQIVEQGRARSLLDLLSETNAGITEGVPAELLKRKQENQSQQEEIAGQLTGATITGEPPDKPLDELEKELNRLQADYESIENQIRAASPRYAALTANAPLTLAQIQQQVLDDQTALVEYSLGQKQSYLWAVTKSGVSLYKLPPRAAIEKQASDFRDQIIPAKLRRSIFDISDPQRGLALSAAPSNDGAAAFATAAHALYQTAFAPAASIVGERRLLVVADGALNYVPFEALVNAPAAAGADYTTLQYLIRKNEIVYAPSASVVAAIRQQATTTGATATTAGSMLIVADPVFDSGDPRAKPSPTSAPQATTATATAGDAARGLTLSSALSDVAGSSSAQGTAAAAATGGVKLARLTGTRAEAQQITQLGRGAGYKVDAWLDLEASEANIEERDLKAYRILHVATHGLLNAERPQFSGVVLSLVGNSEGDGFLRTDEIFNLRLGAPVVILSACETGLGREKRGEGVIGLTRAFMYAGAPTVGVSLWSVSDRSTAELMTDFYKRLLAKGATDSPSAAMRAARQNMIAGKKYSAPFYWAPFVLVGDWR